MKAALSLEGRVGGEAPERARPRDGAAASGGSWPSAKGRQRRGTPSEVRRSGEREPVTGSATGIYVLKSLFVFQRVLQPLPHFSCYHRKAGGAACCSATQATDHEHECRYKYPRCLVRCLGFLGTIPKHPLPLSFISRLAPSPEVPFVAFTTYRFVSTRAAANSRIYFTAHSTEQLAVSRVEVKPHNPKHGYSKETSFGASEAFTKELRCDKALRYNCKKKTGTCTWSYTRAQGSGLHCKGCKKNKEGPIKPFIACGIHSGH